MESWDDADRAIAFLKQTQGGRATLLLWTIYAPRLDAQRRQSKAFWDGLLTWSSTTKRSPQPLNSCSARCL